MSGDDNTQGAGHSAPKSSHSDFSASNTGDQTHLNSEYSGDFRFKADMEMGSIATKAELDHRINTRPTPELEPHLTPDDGTQAPVDNAISQDNERRIQKLRNSLLNAKERLDEDHELAQVRGQAKQDFSHSD